MLIDLFAIQILIETLVVGKENLANEMPPLGDSVFIHLDALSTGVGREGTVSLILEAIPVRQKKDVFALERPAIE
jgi:hypothetical protein